MMLGMIILVLSILLLGMMLDLILNGHFVPLISLKFQCTWTGVEKRRRYKASLHDIGTGFIGTGQSYRDGFVQIRRNKQGTQLTHMAQDNIRNKAHRSHTVGVH